MPIPVILAVGFVLGAALGPRMPYAPWIDLALALPLAALWLRLLWVQRGPRVSALLLLAFLAGHGARVEQWQRQQALVQHFLKAPAQQVWAGVVRSDLGHSAGDDAKQPGHDRRQLLVQVAVQQDQATAVGVDVWLKLAGEAAHWPRLQPGDQIRFRSKLRPPPPAFMPGQFDGRGLALARGVLARGSIYRRTQLVVMAQNPRWWQLDQRLSRWRQALLEQIDNVLEPEASALTRAMILGDRSDVDQQARLPFDGAGAGHLLAVSGLHVGSFTALIFFIAAWFGRRWEWLMRRVPPRRFAALFAAPAGLAFAYLAGASPSALRAGVMSLAVLLGVALWRPRATLSALGLAALAIVGASPAAVSDPSFVLSFSAVIAILYAAPRLNQWLAGRAALAVPQDIGDTRQQIKDQARRLWRLRLSASIATTLAAGLVSLPLSAYYFGRVAPWGIIANLVVIPLAALALPIAISSVLSGIAVNILALPSLGALLIRFAASLVLSLRDVCGFFSHWPGALIDIPAPSLWALGLIILGLVGLFAWSPRRWLRWTSVALVMGGLLLTFLPALHFHQGLQLYFLPVGQGDATLAVAPNGQTLLVDSGSLVRQGPPRAAQEVVLPFLRQQGISRLDYVAVTHPDSDHYNGLPEVIATTCPRELWWTGQADSKPEWQAMLDAAQTCGTKLRFFDKNHHQVQLGDVEVQVLHPLVGPNEPQHFWPELSFNDNSLVLSLQYGQTRALLMGDAGEIAEDSLLDAGLRGPFDLLKAGHHGSAHSSSRHFLQHVKPQHTVISAGYYNTFGHPAARLLKDLAALHSRVWRTDRQGLISAFSDGEQFSIKGFVTNP